MNFRTKLPILMAACLMLLVSCSPPPGSELAQKEAQKNTQAAAQATQADNVPTANAELPAPTATAESSAPTDGGSGASARAYLEGLIAQTEARTPGSEAETKAAAYIQSEFEAMGYSVELQPFSFTTEDDEELESANVMAVKRGVSEQEIVVGAHYDAVDDGDGVDDNASGTAVLLAAARQVIQLDTPYTVRFIAFGAEENDMNGSRSYVSGLSKVEIQNTIYMINLDSLVAGEKNYVYGDTDSVGNMRDWILADAQRAGFDLEGKTALDMNNADGTPCECADFGPFQEAGIPFAYFEATNWDLGAKDGMTQVDLAFGESGAIRHTQFDTIEYIDKTFPGRIDQNLNIYVSLLVNVLSKFTLTE